MSTTNGKWRRHRDALFDQQKGKCYWCDCQMVRITGPGKHPPNACTVDHLRDRYDPTRYIPPKPGEKRHVAACNACNGRRNKERQEALPREELWRRAHNGGKPIRYADGYERSPIQWPPRLAQNAWDTHVLRRLR